MYLKSLEGSRLLIGSYPPFQYDARGGGGKATLLSSSQRHILQLSFSSETFEIPELNYKTTKFLSLPLPPLLNIKIDMDRLEGTLNKKSGEILLEFESRFIFSIGSIYHFPDLFIKTSLQTGKVEGIIHKEEGLTIQNDGRARLVGIGIIPITGNKILDIFLGLPNEALAVLECEIQY